MVDNLIQQKVCGPRPSVSLTPTVSKDFVGLMDLSAIGKHSFSQECKLTPLFCEYQ
jgi:hypothetical protein